MKETQQRSFFPQQKPLDRTIQFKSTHGLQQLTMSSFDEFTELTNFRKTMLESRRELDRDKRAKGPAPKKRPAARKAPAKKAAAKEPANGSRTAKKTVAKKTVAKKAAVKKAAAGSR